MLNLLLILFGKTLSWAIQFCNLGNGSTWPGHIALKFNKKFLKQLLAKNNYLQVIIVAGTNGKTTTSRMIRTIIENNNKVVIQNQSGANLLNGLASTLLLNADISGKIHADYAIFEVDENALPNILKDVHPEYLLLLNLFRDQLDRYGEVHIIADKWYEALQKIDNKTTCILNADDPEIANLGIQLPLKKNYFGLDDPSLHQPSHEHAADTTHCPKCGEKLVFTKRFFSHLGDWNCQKCSLKRPKLTLDSFEHYPIRGTYNKYNTLAAVLTTKMIGLSDEQIKISLSSFKPAFGRQETIRYNNRKIQVFLSKNPTGFNESLRTIKELEAKYVFPILNDRVPDGTDVSWIWDIDFESLLSKEQHIFVSGDRVYDMAVRLKYAHTFTHEIQTYSDLHNDTVQKILKQVPEDEILYVLPTYSAMLEVRKILTGKKIL